jgi:hypothetical protein
MLMPEWNDVRDYGITNFDSLPSAFLTIFQCITAQVSYYMYTPHSHHHLSSSSS